MLSRGLQPPTPAVDSSPLSLSLANEDRRREAVNAKYRAAMRVATARNSGDVRSDQIDDYCAVISGLPGTKYEHADYQPNGETMLGSMRTKTPSMTNDWRDPEFFTNVSKTIGGGAPPIRGSMPSHRAFRLA